MSRLWDTPEFWARSEADDILKEIPGVEPIALADSLERSAESYDGGLEMAALIVGDLRRRAAAGARFLDGPASEYRRWTYGQVGRWRRLSDSRVVRRRLR